ncbi:hypothetical protein SAMN02949497_3390 [Methylomagnum ishizawai]|uniref:Roadblock/LC7 domain-containing protein n=1 Tax=Methylomagnum ishizawai TaxID=1760988 RepID=A0A1Y6D096_9GAMM|nr:hypothetical protein [Methylomagnum ishizawai]SMF96011.1 hypothetical protein SAMN02949497_3390 [Methylomagnum ishizawai]
MANFVLAEEMYVHPTPAGTYYAVSATDPNPSRRMIQSLLRKQSSPRLALEDLRAWSEIEDEEQALSLLYHAQGLGWVQGFDAPRHCNEQPLEIQLPGLLKTLAVQGKVLLADHQGFYLASSGFPHEVAEELSALSADLANLHARRSGLLVNNLGLASSAWAIVDASGNGKIGFWPLFIGAQRFVLVISGMPHFNHPDFVNLVWILSRRYAT